MRDIRYAFRSLIKSPGLTIVAVFALTLGIGVTTTMFSIVYGVMLKGLAYPDGDRIVAVERSNKIRGINQTGVPIIDFERFKTEQRSFADVGMTTSGTMNVSGTEKAERFDGSWITANVFHMIGVAPVKGAGFQPGDDTPQGRKVAVISYEMWTQRFNKRETIIGELLRVNGTPYTIAGVMPEHFDFPNNDRLWIPIQDDPLATKRESSPQYNVIAKLKPGVSLDQASVDVAGIEKRIVADNKQTDEGYEASAKGFIDSVLGPQPRQLLYTMLGAVFFVLLIACSNVANLLIDRAAHRSKEVGIRTALGASRAAIVRQFLAEALLLAVGGTALGIVVAKIGINLFNSAIVNQQIPSFVDIRLHPPVLVFTVAMAVVATLFSGVIPALQSSRADINEILKDETRGSSSLKIGKMSKALVMFEVALSCGLLVAAGLMVKSVTKMRTMDPGFVTRNVFTARVGFPAGYTDTLAQRTFFVQLAERVGQLPGVQASTVSSGLPGARQGLGGNNFALEGANYAKPTDHPNTRTLAVTPGFFTTLQIRAREGRLFNSSDRADGMPVAVVNEAFAKKYFPKESALGHRIRYDSDDGKQPWLTIVGVVPTIFGGDPENPRPALVFRPLEQAHSSFNYITARTAATPMALTNAVREIASQLNPDIPLYWVMSYDDAIAQPLWFVRVFGTMFMIFGFIALFLASVGLYAVMSFSVSRRAREVGIRMALGARALDVVRMIFRQGLLQVGIGLAAGLTLALGISRLLSVILFDVQPRDPVVFGGVAAVLLATSAVACLIPARRATRIDPLTALRSE